MIGSWQAYRTLFRRELGSHFVSWTGYVIISAVLFLLGLCFVNLIQALNAEATDQPIMELFFSTYYFWLILLLASPIITMRVFALEKYSGTFETLMTTPVSDWEVVLAKFSAALVFYLLMWLPMLGLVFVVRHYGNDPSVLDWGTLAGTSLGIFLLGLLFMSLGCFASALTRSLIIAAMIAFALGISIFLVSFLAFSSPGQAGWQARVFQQVSLIEHMKDFARGVVDTRALVFYLSVTVLFLFLTLKVVESRRWK
jgi:ABC-2 type transport system permease protein